MNSTPRGNSRILIYAANESARFIEKSIVSSASDYFVGMKKWLRLEEIGVK